MSEINETTYKCKSSSTFELKNIKNKQKNDMKNVFTGVKVNRKFIRII